MADNMNDRSATARRRGFTLIEMLILAAVLAMLIALVTQLAAFVRNRGCERFTAAVIARVDQALVLYQQSCQVYPADRFAPEVRPGPSHGAQTEGVECLVRAVVGPRVFWSEPRYERALGDTDQDVAADGTPLNELLDGWGRPLLYYHGYGSDPGGSEQGRPLPAFPGVDPERMAKLNQSLQVRWVRAGRRPLVDSAGPDGLFDTTDDCRQKPLPTDRRYDEEVQPQ